MGKSGTKICMYAVHCVFGSDTLHVSYLTLQTFEMEFFYCESFSEVELYDCISLINVCCNVP